ncbi:hypothetical protein ACP275_03G088600 [Erythranthe tilingii]
MATPSSTTTLQFSLTTLLFSFTLILTPTNAQNTPNNNNNNNTIPYQTVNNFCLHKRLNVDKPFCLRVLKNPYVSNAKPDDLIPLLEVATNSTSAFICKTLSILQDMYDDMKTKPALIPVLEDCLSAYEDVAGYITNIMSDASQESAIAGLDGEVIGEYINGCVESEEKEVDPEISARNQVAKNYAKLLIDIADNLDTEKIK